jgi:hypothetical protein
MRKTRIVAVTALALLALAAVASGEVVQRGHLRVTFEGELTPQRLPRETPAPVHVSVAAKIETTNASAPPQLRTMTIAINSAGKFDTGLVPTCTIRDIQPSTTQKALEACGESVVGSGTFAAKLLLPQQAAFPSSGKLVAFNGTYKGRPAILAHVYGTEPVPTSFTLPFVISERKGQLGTVLSASLAGITGKAGYITGLSLDLGRTVGSGKRKRGFLNADCPAPKGFPGAVFPFARASFDFGSRKLSSTITRKCEVQG